MAGNPRTRIVALVAVFLAMRFDFIDNAFAERRATFITSWPPGALAIVDAPTLYQAQRKKRVVIPINGCVSIPRREDEFDVFVYINHYFPDDVGERGFFVIRVIASQKDNPTIVHAQRNDGWLDLESGEPLRDFYLPLGGNISFEELSTLYSELAQAQNAATVAQRINTLLSNPENGKFLALREGTDISSAAELNLFRTKMKPTNNVWYYLMAFTSSGPQIRENTKKPIFYFQTIGGIDEYLVEAVPNSAFAVGIRRLTVKIGIPC